MDVHLVGSASTTVTSVMVRRFRLADDSPRTCPFNSRKAEAGVIGWTSACRVLLSD
jgi:hypothetical protein